LERTVRVNVTARESQLDKIDRLARSAGLTRSAFMVQAAIKQEAKLAHRPRTKRLKEASA